MSIQQSLSYLRNWSVAEQEESKNGINAQSIEINEPSIR